ncbi:acyltransferase domain-containing protein [Amycolatopsis minnesotensis]|uniref:type I polyketide synthase n=1 Tax=Amycolatopsis minnesotensis TaxID=337894 RepID=UPI0031DAB04E
MSLDMDPGNAVAIIGMSCRFAPDLDSLDRFWSFLVNGRFTVRDMPSKRWDPYESSSPQATAILRSTVRRGSFLDDIEGFDAEFFGISPREADYLDPQQRFMLELTWEALVDSGIQPLALRNTDTGVFVASNSNDYGRRLLEDIPRTGPYAVNGTTFYGIANRVSYFLDLRGPSLAVDTACAGSLTALHLACQSLHANETSLAIVGAANIMSTPALNVALDSAGAMSADGRSKAFDMAADGYGRGEGAGVLVLKPLADARRDCDPVRAVIRGSGVFQDGRSDGMMAPSSVAQEHMLREVYDRSGIAPSTVDYVEAHGTGTPAGDGEEARALAKVFGNEGSAGDPLRFGSVKPNIGHNEGAAGIAGVIKTVLAMRHEEIPPSLHTEIHPDLAQAGTGLQLVKERSPWLRGQHPRRAGVSSYGVGGTIAHLILEEPAAAPNPPSDTQPDDGLSVFPVSAMSEAGLRALAGKMADWLEENPRHSLASVGYTLSRRRSHLSHRGAVVARSAAELTKRLRALAEGVSAPGVVTGRTAPGQADGVIWVFSGHGAQWSGMGRDLLREEPAFAATMDLLEEVFREELGWTPREAIEGGGPWTTCQIQSLTFAVQLGLAAVWRQYGARPAAVLGHSVGEIAAAVEAGCLDPLEAARFACRRAAALQSVAGRGAMALVGLPIREIRHRLAGLTDVEAAISASPYSTVISGTHETVTKLSARWRAAGVDVRAVDTDVAFHSHHVDEIVDEVAAAAKELTYRPPAVYLYNTALADPRAAAVRDADYWVANLRQPVRFAEAVEAAVEDGHRMFLEVSSHPVVTHSIIETFNQVGVEDATALPTLRRDSAEAEVLRNRLAELHCKGALVDWSAQYPVADLTPLPAVAWQHQPYWIFPEVNEVGPGGGHDPDKHTLLGGRMTVSGRPGKVVWQTHLDLSCRPYPQDHRVVGVEITPAASIINTFVAAATPDGRPTALTDLVLRTPLAVTPPRTVQVVRSGNTVQLASRIAAADSGDQENEWLTHTTAIIDPSLTVPDDRVDDATIRARCSEEWEWSRVDELFRTKGVEGYAFPWNLDELRRDDNEQLSVLTLLPAPARVADSWAHVIDAALTISAVLVTPENARRLWMSCAIGSIVFHGEPPARILVHSRRSTESPQDTVDVSVADEHGHVVCEVGALRFAELQDRAGAATRPGELVHEIVWRPMSRPEQSTVRGPLEQLTLVGDGGVVKVLAELAERAGVRCVRVRTPEDLSPELRCAPGPVVVAPDTGRIGESPEEAVERCTWTLVRTAQLLAGEAGVTGNAGKPRLWCVTLGVRDAGSDSALAHAPLWGAARILAGEHPDLYGGVLDLADLTPSTVERALSLLNSGATGEEDVISVTAEEEAVARLSPSRRTSDRTTWSAEGGLVRCRPNGTYFVTGGLGALGLEVARFLVDRGARRLLLAGRRGLPPRTEWPEVRDEATRRQIEGVLALEAQGVTVVVLALDVTDAEAVEQSLDPASHRLPPIRGVVHAAGATSDAIVDKTDRDGLRHALRPKVNGALVLHRLFPPGSLDFFVMFSSCGQFARLTGQTSYAAANSFLDALAAHRHHGGHRDTISLGWTSWRGLGMSAGIGSTMIEANARGLEAVTSAEAVSAWSFADRFRVPYQAIAKMLPVPATTPRPPMFRDLVVDADPGAAEDQDARLDWEGRSAQELRDLVLADVREQVGAELNLPTDKVEPRRPLVELGVDSVMSVAIRVRMQRRYGLDLPPTILWNAPTVTALATHVVESLQAPATDAGDDCRATN